MSDNTPLIPDPKHLVDFFTENYLNKKRIGAGVYISAKVHQDFHIGVYQGKLTIGGMKREIKFYGYSNGFFLAYMER